MTELSIVVLNRSSEDPMSVVLSGLSQPNLEFIYVTPDATDHVKVRRVSSNTIRVEYPNTAEVEVDRLLGATYASGGYILFIDTSCLFLPYEVTNMHTSLMDGASIVLKSRYPRDPEMKDPIDLASMALNLILNRSDLGAASLTRFPHGLRQDVFHTIPREELLNPPKFLVKSVLNGLGVATFYRAEDPVLTVDDHVRSHVAASHLEAIREIVGHTGPRGGLTDLSRRRNARVTSA